MQETLIPAYGRDYKSKAAVLSDWNAGKDFKCALSGRHVNKPDAMTYLVKQGQTDVTIRYNKLTQVVIIKLK